MVRLKKIYLGKIDSLINDYEKFQRFTIVKYQNMLIQGEELKKIQNIIENITKDEIIEPNKKYILINEKLDEIEKVSNVLSGMKNEVLIRKESITKDKRMLIETCLEEQKDLTIDDILNVITIRMSEKGLKDEDI